MKQVDWFEQYLNVLVAEPGHRKSNVNKSNTMDELNTLTENLSIVQKDTFQLDGIEGDLIVNSGDVSFKVHKSILKSCPYFAAIIDGEWQESRTSEITLQG